MIQHTRLPAALALALALAACGKQEETAAKPGDAAATAAAAASGTENADKPAVAAPALPQPDPAKPLSSYQELKSGNQIMFLYVAASRLPPDYEKLASSFSNEYRSTSDSFRKNDLLQAIRPQLDAKIAQAKADPYGWMEIDGSDALAAYDFGRKGFPVSEFASGGSSYFNDAYDYKITWSNGAQLAFAPVPDEATARQLEAMRTKYGQWPRLKVFFFAQAADLNNQTVQALVTRVQITDKSGRVLAEYEPDGSVPVKAETGSADSPADAASIAADVFGG